MSRRGHDKTTRRRGLTLIETMLAIGVTGVIGAAVGSMLFSTARGSDSRTNLRSLVVKHKTIGGRLSAAIRSSRLVLDAGADYLVLWTADHNDSGVPDLTELRMIERNAHDELHSYVAVWPDHWTAGQISDADVAYQLSDDFKSIVDARKGGSNAGEMPGELWGSGVTALSLAFDTADEQDASLVSFRLVLTNGSLKDIGIGAAALRAELD